ncbi:MAG: Maf family protein [bacterium]|nr:septum formation protein Maf [Gammaproteobacteria bacterium]HIL97144.1 septum formation protein Maf [Pseudomonadales bacterium]
MSTKLVLASTSAYRGALLRQLGLEFNQIDPGVEETLVQRESAAKRATRLARHKASYGALKYLENTQDINDTGQANNGTTASRIVIGSDQVAHLGNTILSKPGGFDPAFQQLTQCAGRWVKFSTAICLVDGFGQVLAEGIDTYEIKYRDLSVSEIQKYLQTEQPYDCAGSIMAEQRGIALIEKSKGRDITTLFGLPLILLTDLLIESGFSVINNFN